MFHQQGECRHCVIWGDFSKKATGFQFIQQRWVKLDVQLERVKQFGLWLEKESGL
jgi:hypothetical protein